MKFSQSENWVKNVQKFVFLFILRLETIFCYYNWPFPAASDGVTAPPKGPVQFGRLSRVGAVHSFSTAAHSETTRQSVKFGLKSNSSQNCKPIPIIVVR